MGIKKILILGSGAREHALSWKLGKELGKNNVFIAPGNAGTAVCGINIDAGVSDFEKLAKACETHNIDFILPGSEEAIANGVRNYFEEKSELNSVYVFSPDQYAGQLESSKDFAKEFMIRHDIPTAAYQTFEEKSLTEGKAFLATLHPPYVLKADGLAAGKGVLIIEDLKEAQDALEDMVVQKQFGDASSKVVIEEFLDGIEFSMFAITDGENYVLLPEAKDYKRIGEGDTGLNTGGMGAVSPVPFFDSELEATTLKEVVEPTIAGLKKDNLNFRGFVFFGLIAVNGKPKVIEYNVRMGDPETEVVIPRLDESLSDILASMKLGGLTSRVANAKSGYCTTVFGVSGGYPEAYNKGVAIQINAESETLFHAGTALSDTGLVTSGGRVLAATALGNSMPDALQNSYRLLDKVKFEGMYFRTDIGNDLKKYL